MDSDSWNDYFELMKTNPKNIDLKRLYLAILCHFLFFPSIQKLCMENKASLLDFMRKNQELLWLMDYFNVKVDEKIEEYLKTHNEWYTLLESLLSEKPTYYSISKFYESMKIRGNRRKGGIFFSNRKQIDLTCKLTLLSYIGQKTKKTNEKELLELIFSNKANKTINEEQRKEINELLSDIRIIDPSCGTGLFLVGMINIIKNLVNLEQLDLFDNIYGFDIDSESIKLAKLFFFHVVNSETAKLDFQANFQKITTNITVKDFMKSEMENERYDLIIGNPPYIRHHTISHQYKYILLPEFNKALKKYFRKITTKIDKKADLYIYFILKSIILLNEGGTLAFIISRAWLSSKYSDILTEVFKNYFRLKLILEAPRDFWFDAAIKTHVIVGNKCEKGEKSNDTSLIMSKKTIKYLPEKILANSLVKNSSQEILNFTEKIRITLYEDSYLRISRISNVENLLRIDEKNFPILRLDYLLAPKILLELLQKNRSSFCRLGELGKVQMGSTTGYNRYFYLDNEKVRLLDIEDEFLHKMTKSPRDWKTLDTTYVESNLYVLNIKESVTKYENAKAVIRYLKEIEPKLLKRPYFKNKNKSNWYIIQLVIPQFLIPNMTFKRSFIALNKGNLHIDKQFIGFTFEKTANEDQLYAFLAIVNSTISNLLREIQGTKTLGLGSLKISLAEAKNLLVINPYKIPEKLQRNLARLGSELSKETIPDFLESESDNNYKRIQREIDKILLCDYLGYNEKIIDKLEKAFEFEITCRLTKR
ncbi:MAG: Eco57I restriction-modification methylase domain-containing protein [Candidatus Hodarchaeales archaeon]